MTPRRSITRPVPACLGSLALLLAIIGLAIAGSRHAAAQSGAPGPTQQYAPAYGATGVSTSTYLQWYQPSGASAGYTQYTAYVYDTTSGANYYTPYTTNTYIYVTGLGAGHTIYWEVYACNGSACAFSNGYWYFVTAAGSVAPSPAQQYSPANGAGGVSTSPTFAWYQPAGATAGYTQYYVWYYDTATGGSGSSAWTSATSVTAYNLNAGHYYYWYVYACNGSACSTSSSAWSFTTSTAGSAPGATQQYAPPNGATGVRTSPALQWYQPSGAVAGYTQYSVYYQDANTGATAYSPYTTGQAIVLSNLTGGHLFYWWVYACNGSACSYSASSWSFTTANTSTPGPTQQVAPANGAANVSTAPTLSWSQPSGAIAGSTQYQATYQDSTSGVWTSTAYTTQLSLSLSGLAYGRLYYWAVYACNTGCSVSSSSWSFTTIVATPGSAQQQTPSNGATGIGTAPILTWSQPTGAAPGVTQYYVGYQDSTTGVWSYTAYTPNQSQQLSGLAAGRTYYWVVYACNVSCSNSTSSWGFTTIQGTPGPVQQVSPANGATGQSTSPTLTWSAPSGSSSGVTMYAVNYVDANTGTTGQTSYSTALSATLSGLATGDTYNWAVYACNSACSNSTSYWVFTTAAPAPSPITLYAPANDTTGTGTTPTLTWFPPSSNYLAGTTQFTLSLYDYVTASYLPSLTAPSGSACNGKACSLAVPASANLDVDRTYAWSGVACNGTSCSAASSIFLFTTAPPPSAALQQTPASGASNVSLSPSLTWSQPATNAYAETHYYTTVYDQSAGTYVQQNYDDHTSLSETVSNLAAGHTYTWTDTACNGLNTVVQDCTAAPNSFQFTTAQQSGTPQQTVPDCTTVPPNPQNPKDPTFNKYDCGTAFYYQVPDTTDPVNNPSTWNLTQFVWNGSGGAGGYLRWQFDHGDIWDIGCSSCADWRDVYHYGSEENWHTNQGYLSPEIEFDFSSTGGQPGIRNYATVYWCFHFHNDAVYDPETGRQTAPPKDDFGEWKGHLDAMSAAFYTLPGGGCPS